MDLGIAQDMHNAILDVLNSPILALNITYLLSIAHKHISKESKIAQLKYGLSVFPSLNISKTTNYLFKFYCMPLGYHKVTKA